MCFNNIWRRIAPFAITVGLGLSAVNISQRENLTETKQEKSIAKFAHPENVQSEKGTGVSGGADKGLPPFYIPESPKSSNSKTNALKIISKPRPNYTDAARQNQVQGTVRLRVIFLASGEIGNISPISDLSGGLTEQAIAAAKQIKFKPATHNGESISTVKVVEYSFTLY